MLSLDLLNFIPADVVPSYYEDDDSEVPADTIGEVRSTPLFDVFDDGGGGYDSILDVVPKDQKHLDFGGDVLQDDVLRGCLEIVVPF